MGSVAHLPGSLRLLDLGKCAESRSQGPQEGLKQCSTEFRSSPLKVSNSFAGVLVILTMLSHLVMKMLRRDLLRLCLDFLLVLAPGAGLFSFYQS